MQSAWLDPSVRVWIDLEAASERELLAIKDVFRVHYEQTRMQRDGLFVDVALPSSEGPSSGEVTKTIRLCNTHLESLALEPPRKHTRYPRRRALLRQLPS